MREPAASANARRLPAGDHASASTVRFESLVVSEVATSSEHTPSVPSIECACLGMARCRRYAREGERQPTAMNRLSSPDTQPQWRPVRTKERHAHIFQMKGGLAEGGCKC
jgi:hypothetical protein